MYMSLYCWPVTQVLFHEMNGPYDRDNCFDAPTRVPSFYLPQYINHAGFTFWCNFVLIIIIKISWFWHKPFGATCKPFQTVRELNQKPVRASVRSLRMSKFIYSLSSWYQFCPLREYYSGCPMMSNWSIAPIVGEFADSITWKVPPPAVYAAYRSELRCGRLCQENDAWVWEQVECHSSLKLLCEYGELISKCCLARLYPPSKKGMHKYDCFSTQK